MNVWGTLVGVAVLAVGISGIQQLGADFYVEPLFNGVTLIASIGIAGYAQRKRIGSIEKRLSASALAGPVKAFPLGTPADAPIRFPSGPSLFQRRTCLIARTTMSGAYPLRSPQSTRRKTIRRASGPGGPLWPTKRSAPRFGV